LDHLIESIRGLLELDALICLLVVRVFANDIADEVLNEV